MSSKTEELWGLLAIEPGLEGKLDVLRKFKRDQSAPLQEKFLKGKLSFPGLMEALTQLADAALMGAYAMAVENLRPTLGTPRFIDQDGKEQPGEFAIIGMGKLGGRELHFGSDLDVLFIYNRNGETVGARPVTNREYFAKLTQRIISYLTLHTALGYAYKVDTELRPSGLAGALVTPIESWIDYYHEMSQLWERQALLKARLIYASGDFKNEFQGLFKRLIFFKPFPENLGEEIHRLRLRMEKELAKESPQRWHFKKGFGGLVEIEFLVQYLQLKMGNTDEDLLCPNTLAALNVISRKKFLTYDQMELLNDAYEFYRRLEFYTASRPEWGEGYLNPRSKALTSLALKMGFENREDFLERFTYYRNGVRRIYLRTLKVQGP